MSCGLEMPDMCGVMQTWSAVSKQLTNNEQDVKERIMA
jgi:hypothetical protein